MSPTLYAFVNVDSVRLNLAKDSLRSLLPVRWTSVCGTLHSIAGSVIDLMVTGVFPYMHIFSAVSTNSVPVSVMSTALLLSLRTGAMDASVMMEWSRSWRFWVAVLVASVSPLTTHLILYSPANKDAGVVTWIFVPTMAAEAASTLEKEEGNVC